MKKAAIVVLLVINWGCATVSPPPPPPQSAPLYPLKSLPGLYEGKISSGGLDWRSITRFQVIENGKILGTYTFKDNQGRIDGTLDDCQTEGPYTLLCTWKDKYGVGKLRMLFSEEARWFRGFWGRGANDTLMLWEGIKTEKEPDFTSN